MSPDFAGGDRESCNEASADADGELAANASVDEVAQRHSDLAERVGAFHRGRQIAGLDEAGEHDQISSVLRADERAELVTHERGQEHGSYLPVGSAEPAAVGLSADDEQPSVVGQCPAEPAEGPVSGDV